MRDKLLILSLFCHCSHSMPTGPPNPQGKSWMMHRTACPTACISCDGSVGRERRRFSSGSHADCWKFVMCVDGVIFPPSHILLFRFLDASTWRWTINTLVRITFVCRLRLFVFTVRKLRCICDIPAYSFISFLCPGSSDKSFRIRFVNTIRSSISHGSEQWLFNAGAVANFGGAKLYSYTTEQ